jgi:hypothetical protein
MAYQGVGLLKARVSDHRFGERFWQCTLMCSTHAGSDRSLGILSAFLCSALSNGSQRVTYATHKRRKCFTLSSSFGTLGIWGSWLLLSYISTAVAAFVLFCTG